MIEPARSILIPKFEEVKNEALNQGALGSGISGSGPSIFALSKGMATAKKAGNAMAEIYKSIGLEYDMYLSPINKIGIKTDFLLFKSIATITELAIANTFLLSISTNQ